MCQLQLSSEGHFYKLCNYQVFMEGRVRGRHASENYIPANWWVEETFCKVHICTRAATQFTLCTQNVHHWPKRKLAFSAIFPKLLGISSPNFTRLLNVHIYTRIQIFILLYPTVTKLCHILCDRPECISVDGGHFEHIMVVVLNMA